MFHFNWYDDTYVAAPDSKTLLLAETAPLIKEIIDLHLDGGEVREDLARVFDHIGNIDILIFRHGQPPGSSDVSAHAASLNEGDTSTIYAYFQFGEVGRADQAMEWFTDKPDLSNAFWGYNSETIEPKGEIRREGDTIIVEATAPDKDLTDLFFSN